MEEIIVLRVVLFIEDRTYSIHPGLGHVYNTIRLSEAKMSDKSSKKRKFFRCNGWGEAAASSVKIL